MYCSNIFLTVAAIFVALSTASPFGTEERNFRGYTECKNQDDCPRGYCCTLGMQRNSVPACMPFGLKEDPCIPSNPKARHFSLSYPNTREAVEVESAFLLLCPCDRNFACDRDSNSCQDPATLKYKPLDKSEAPNDI